MFCCGMASVVEVACMLWVTVCRTLHMSKYFFSFRRARWHAQSAHSLIDKPFRTVCIRIASVLLLYA